MINISHQICAGLAVCMLLSLTVAPSRAAGAKRNLDLTPCETQFEAYRDTSLAANQERLPREQSSAKPWIAVIERLKESIAAAQTMSGGDFFGSLGGGMPPTHMHSFLQKLPLPEVRQRQKQEKAMIEALKAKDWDGYEVLKGARPHGPVAVAYLQAMSAAHLCALEARIVQLTGKAR